MEFGNLLPRDNIALRVFCSGRKAAIWMARSSRKCIRCVDLRHWHQGRNDEVFFVWRDWHRQDGAFEKYPEDIARLLGF
jgi:hypothetical protein